MSEERFTIPSSEEVGRRLAALPVFAEPTPDTRRSVILSPWARTLPEGKANPKCPSVSYWTKVVRLLQEGDRTLVTQVGLPREPVVPGVRDVRQTRNMSYTLELLDDTDVLLTVDSAMQHFAAERHRPCVCLWSYSDPVIFGHPENVNLVKQPPKMRCKQFELWTMCEFSQDDEAFVSPEECVMVVLRVLLEEHDGDQRGGSDGGTGDHGIGCRAVQA